ncbi:MAG TPA: MlaD family protein [Candidatus Cloacimonadota bacterium]|nr:MlaD family protein [Candidatus Cloacimonadota bacterium]HQH50122.1 MlaD family protein [Candidatus Cloacimonadota bacterium]
MVSKAAKIRLGLFLSVGISILVLFFIVVAGRHLMQSQDIYFIEFENYSVTGLHVGGTVNYNGIPVGRVEEIKIKPNDVTKVVLKVGLDKGTPIKSDSEAILIWVGITGVKAVEIRGGNNQAADLKPKSFIRRGVSSLDDISTRALTIAEKIDVIATNISSMTNPENQANLAGILGKTNSILAATETDLASTLQSLSVLAANAAEMSRKLNSSLDRVNNVLTSAELDSLVANINSISAQLKEADIQNLIGQLSETTSKTGSMVSNVDRLLISNRANLTEILESLREASENLNEFSRQIADQPSIILRGNR